MHAYRSRRASETKGAEPRPKRARPSVPLPAPKPPQPPPSDRMPERLPAYFYRLSAADQRRYLASDSVPGLPLKVTDAVMARVAALRAALETEDLRAVTRAAQQLLDALSRALDVTPAAVEVRGVRPRNHRGELHGIFYPRTRPPRIVLWARTARRHEPVAPKTFLRTLIHELVHHLDYALLKLGASFHTYGFFQRESFLVRALSIAEDGRARAAAESAKNPTAMHGTKTLYAPRVVDARSAQPSR